MVIRALALCCFAWPAAACPPVPSAEAQVHLDAINTVRAAAGRAPLSLHPALARMARFHACAMAASGVFDHTGPDGAGLAVRARRHGLRGFCRLAENIAQGQRDIPAVMDSWLRAPGHRANLLALGMTHVGVARAPGPHWVQVLAGRCATDQPG